MRMPWEFSENERRIQPMGKRRSAAFIYNFNGACYYCLQPVEASTPKHERHPTRDHKTPKTRGGSGAKENIVLACVGCNHVKADMTEAEFRHFMSTGTFAPSYIEWLTGKFTRAAVRLGVPVSRAHGQQVREEK